MSDDVPATRLRGTLPFSSWFTSTTTTFIPLSTLRPVLSTNGAADSIIIHEGLQRWSVKFYLAIMHCVESGSLAGRVSDSSRIVASEKMKRGGEWKVQVAFPSLQPRLPILREVYYGLRQVLFDDFEEDLP
ncbi:hypothetical protein QFC24_001641 [Naganishia onofrii]|uniref:Uncharacterized protein n=1 Tax=Naganishia onofrii TaxID=1851511 RepID=A0ACC2XTP8_9TREE|nr:hypothetical protein QFC24_001641 [Naganishia onofrii]